MKKIIITLLFSFFTISNGYSMEKSTSNNIDRQITELNTYVTQIRNGIKILKEELILHKINTYKITTAQPRFIQRLYNKSVGIFVKSYIAFWEKTSQQQHSEICSEYFKKYNFLICPHTKTDYPYICTIFKFFAL